MKAPPLSDPRWPAWTGDLRRYIVEGGTEITAWCAKRGLNQWTEVNLRAAVDLIDGPNHGEPQNFEDEFFAQVKRPVKDTTAIPR